VSAQAEADLRATAVVEAGGMLRASQKAVVEAALERRPGVEEIEANPVAQTATVTYDPAVTSVEELRRWINECGFHCAGQSVPDHVCAPAPESGEPGGPPPEGAAPDEGPTGVPGEVMGPGGHGEMSTAAMVRDMRNRFLVAALFSIPIVFWSPLGREVFGFEAPVPFGLREDVSPGRARVGHDARARVLRARRGRWLSRARRA
jgi:P-type Cu2+ transporter